MKVAIVHYWLVRMRGGEQVLEALCELFPQADIHTHVFDPAAVSETIRRHPVHTSFIQRLPGARRWYQKYLPLMPIALEQMDLRGYDLVISVESGPAKGVIVPPEATHVCYCCTPMRYLWDMVHDYRENAGFLTRWVTPILTHYLRLWDQASAARVDRFVASSSYVAARIRKYYRREATVIPPPVDTGAFQPARERDDFYLMVGQLVGYKRTDLAIEAFRRLDRRLVIIGAGAEFGRLRAKAGPNVTLMGYQSPEVLRDHYGRCRALIFPGKEDFGIVPVEAMAAGKPVIAYHRGGVRDSVVDGKTGVFFDAQTPDALIEAVRRFESLEAHFVTEEIVRHARQFDRRVFKERMEKFIQESLRGEEERGTRSLSKNLTHRC